MAIKAHNAGSLSFTEIVAEWGGSTPHGLDEYHSGESLVYAGATGAPGGTTTTIPSSGTISFSNFYGSAAFVNSPVNFTLFPTGAVKIKNFRQFENSSTARRKFNFFSVNLCAPWSCSPAVSRAPGTSRP